MPRLPAWLFQMLFFGSVAVLVTGGVQYQIARKQRTSFHDKLYIEDARSGNSTRYRVLVGKNDTAGEYFTLEVLMRAQAYGAVRDKPGSEAAHYHLFQTETVRVRQGKLGYFIGHQSHVQAAEAGAEVVIQPGESHMLFNAGGGAEGSDLLLEVTFAPARHGEALYETLAGLGYDYESPLAVSPLQRLLTLARGETVLSDMPPATWDAVTSYVLPLVEGLGYKPFYSQYTTRREYAPDGAAWAGPPAAGSSLHGGDDDDADDDGLHGDDSAFDDMLMRGEEE